MCTEWESEKKSKQPKEASKHLDLDKLDGFLTAKKNIVQPKKKLDKRYHNKWWVNKRQTNHKLKKKNLDDRRVHMFTLWRQDTLIRIKFAGCSIVHVYEKEKETMNLVYSNAQYNWFLNAYMRRGYRLNVPTLFLCLCVKYDCSEES